MADSTMTDHVCVWTRSGTLSYLRVAAARLSQLFACQKRARTVRPPIRAIAILVMNGRSVLVGFLLVAAGQALGAVPTIRQACAADFKMFCSDVQPGGGRVLACLRDNSAKLSSDCRNAMSAAQTGH